MISLQKHVSNNIISLQKYISNNFNLLTNRKVELKKRKLITNDIFFYKNIFISLQKQISNNLIFLQIEGVEL